MGYPLIIVVVVAELPTTTLCASDKTLYKDELLSNEINSVNPPYSEVFNIATVLNPVAKSDVTRVTQKKVTGLPPIALLKFIYVFAPNDIAFKPFIFTVLVTGVPPPILAEPPVDPLFFQPVTEYPSEAVIVVVSEASNQNTQLLIVKGKPVNVFPPPPPPLDTEYVILILP